MAYVAARLTHEMLAYLTKRIGYRESARWAGLIGYDRKASEAIAPDGSRRTINAAEIVFASSVEIEAAEAGRIDLVRATFPGVTISTFKPYWLS